MGLYKESLISLFAIGFIGLGKAMDKSNELKPFFINLIKQNVKMVVLIEFFTSFYVMNLYLELILVLILILLGAMVAYSSHKVSSDKKYLPLVNFLDKIVTAIGCILLVFVIYSFIKRPLDLFTVFNLKELLLPLVAAILYMPLIYLTVVWSSYENLYSRLKFLIGDQETLQWTKQKIFLICKLNIERINRVISKFTWQNTYTKEEISSLLQDV